MPVCTLYCNQTLIFTASVQRSTSCCTLKVKTFFLGFADLTTLVHELIARWRKAKNEIIRRQSDIKDCFEWLSRFNKGIEQHVGFIERKEQEFHSINKTNAETSESIERKIEALEDVQKDLKEHRANFAQVKS